MSTVQDARAAVAVLLETVTDLEVYRFFPGSVNPPAAVVWPDSGVDPVTLDRQSDARMVVRLFAQDGETEEAQDNLDQLLDDVCEALKTGTSQVTWDNYGLSEWNGVQYLTVDVRFGVFV